MCVAVVLAGQAARADEIAGFPIRFGIFGGWHATSDDYDVLGERRADLVPGAGATFGLRLGLRLSPPLALELEAGLVPAPVEHGRDTAWLVPARVSLDWRPLSDATSGTVTPLVGLGVGIAANVAGPGSGDADVMFALSGGLEWHVAPALSLRFEGGLFATDGVSSAVSWTPFATVGIDVLGWVERSRPSEELVVAPEPEPLPEPKPEPAPEPKRMLSGCPAGVAATSCVDTDGDGLIDAFDACPVDAGRRADGCPDPDGDGVTGLRDACPRDRGAELDWGCPR